MAFYGEKIKLTVYGTSHGPFVGASMEGLPKGIKINRDALDAFMARRAPGNNEFSTPRKEADKVNFVRGLDINGRTNGEPLEVQIQNTNTRSTDYSTHRDVPRPGHADFAEWEKNHGLSDMAGGGRFSGRLTAPLCALGAVALQILSECKITVGAHIYSVENEKDIPMDGVSVNAKELKELKARAFPTIDADAGERMQAAILEARSDGDSAGGVVECAAVGLPTGMGDFMFSGIESRIASLCFGIPAVKGVEFGAGFEAAKMRGSENNDPFYVDRGKIKTKTNNAGGLLGGITFGMPLVFRCAFKPTPSIAKEQDSVSISKMENTKMTVKGRHDPCVVLRAVPVVEAVCALALLDVMIVEKRV